MKNILPGSFLVFKIIGFWKPITWESSRLGWLYTLYMSFSFFMIYSLAITGIIGLINNSHKDIKQVTNDCFILLSVFAVSGKAFNVVKSRETIIWIMETLQNNPCVPIDEEEVLIQRKIDRLIWNYTIYYLVLTEMSLLLNTVGHLFQDIQTGELLYNSYIPWDYSKGFLYWLAYVYQFISVALSSNVAIAYDTMVPGLMLQVSAKLEILKHRFNNFAILLELTLSSVSRHDEKYNEKKLEMEKKLVTHYTKYHILIFKLASTINSTFNLVIFIQCSISTIVICVSAYNLADTELFSAEFTGIIIYFCCMLTEIFILCAAGNEVTLVSDSVSEAIYAMDWTNLNPNTVKSLIIIMNRSLHPILFTSGSMVTLSLDTFKSLIKISYSTFNVLQQTS